MVARWGSGQTIVVICQNNGPGLGAFEPYITILGPKIIKIGGQDTADAQR